VLEQRTRVLEEDLPSCGQSKTPARPAEELDAKITLERGDLTTQCWLRQMETSGGPADMHLAGHNHEEPKLLDLHDRA
jgi:hypothetical protein